MLLFSSVYDCSLVRVEGIQKSSLLLIISVEVFLFRPVCFHITRTHKFVKLSSYVFSVLALNSKMMDYKRGEKKPYGKK